MGIRRQFRSHAGKKINKIETELMLIWTHCLCVYIFLTEQKRGHKNGA